MSGRKKPEVSIRKPGQRSLPSEEAVRALEAKAEAAQAMPAGVGLPAKVTAVPPPEAPVVSVVARLPEPEILPAEPEVLPAEPEPPKVAPAPPESAPPPKVEVLPVLEVLSPEPKAAPAPTPLEPSAVRVAPPDPALDTPQPTLAAPAPKTARQPATRAARQPAPPPPSRTPRGSWTKAEPYLRKRDGVEARSTTVYLDVELLQKLRRYAFEHDRRQSDVVAEALEMLFAQET